MLLASKEIPKGVKVQPVRSMRKFELDKNQTSLDLEVVKLAHYMPGYLNKQIIQVLWANGVHSRIFRQIQHSYIDKMLAFYKLSKVGEKYKNHDEILQSISLISRNVLSANQKGKSYSDPFLHPMVMSIAYSKILKVRNKFKIYDEHGCNLFGVIDPYNCLEEGEVFIQFNKYVKHPHERAAYDHTLITGDVLVSRSPCVHPGDMRVLEAVNEPALLDFVNVIIFSAKGDRPEQHKMGYGDLDGDIYWINWRPEFIKSFVQAEPSEPPVGFFEGEPSVPLTDYSEEVGQQDCIDNFLDYIRKDFLGQIANLHCKIADQHQNNLHLVDCMTLARMHTQAIDGQKRDVEFDPEEFKQIKRKFDFEVDFMSRGRHKIGKKNIRPSPGVIGILYRDLQNYVQKDHIIELEYMFKIKRDYWIPERLWKDMKICNHLPYIYSSIVRPYNDSIRNLLHSKGLCSEGDLFISNSLLSSMVATKEELFQSREDVTIILEGMRDTYRKKLKEYQEDYFKHTEQENSSKEFKLHPVLNKALEFATYFNIWQKDSP